MYSDGHSLPPGYMGKILRIDLTNKSYETETLDPDLARRFFGGRGLGVALLCRHFLELLKEGRYTNPFVQVDPLSEDNVIIVSTSPTTGTRMPTSGRIHMNYKSPLTEGYGSTNAGGRWSVDLKRTGCDAIVITGKSPRPVYLVLTSAGVEFMDAGPTAQLDAIETRELLKKASANRAQVLSIGPAGKNLVRFAAVMSDTGKALGRGGGGAVWGSKNLFAIAVVPDEKIRINVADKESFNIENKNGAMYHVKLKLDLGKFTKSEDMFGVLASMGSLGILGMVNNYRQLIHNNMRDTKHSIDDINKINGEALRYHAKRAKPGEKKITVKKSACFNCPIICKRQTTLFDGEGRIIEKGEGPEFETVALMGANLSIYDLATITEACYLSNHCGIDTISLGGTLAAFFDLYETLKAKGTTLTSTEGQLFEDLKDFIAEHGEPVFGRPEILVPLTRLIGTATGIGKYLGQGSYRFCERYGHPELSMTVKKLELPAYDPRTSYTQALSYEMSNRGGCHLEGGYTAPYAYCAGYEEWPAHRVEGTPLISKNATLKNTTLDIIGACAYSSFSLGLDEYAALVNGVTGDKHNSGTLEHLAVRTITLERVFNILCGMDRNDDWLPDRFYSESIHTRDGDVICDHSAFERMHKEYYRSVGWDESGRPTPGTLRELQLSDLIPEDTDLASA
jgi:aldehyde:ferredoxin oxidoreductase